MKKRTAVALIIAAVLASAACGGNVYLRTVRKSLQIEHVLSRPTTAYGPGCVVMYEKASGYTGVCEPAWIVDPYQPVVGPISDVGISREATIDLKVDLSAADKAKLGAAYKNISRLTLALTNGRQGEIIADLAKVFDKIKNGICSGNTAILKRNHPEARFYFVRVAYAYDIDIQIRNENGVVISGEIPESVLDVLNAKVGLGLDLKRIYEQKMTGKGLYIGFNGTPVAPPEPAIALDEEVLAAKITLPKTTVIDITEIIK
jgi:hypothetical protein